MQCVNRCVRPNRNFRTWVPLFTHLFASSASIHNSTQREIVLGHVTRRDDECRLFRKASFSFGFRQLKVAEMDGRARALPPEQNVKPQGNAAP